VTGAPPWTPPLMPGLPMLGRLLLAIGALCLLVCAPAQAQWEVGTDGLAPIPKLAARVTDLTGTLSAGDRQALEAKLAAWEQSSGNQLVVLMVPSTKPEPIEAYSIRVAEAWKIGRKGQDNGALFLVAKDDKKMRIETGYGLEGSLTDVTSRRIIAEKVAPKFSAGQFAAGINAGTDEIMAVVNKGEPAAARPAPSAQRGHGGGFDLGTLFILVFVIVPILGAVLRGIFGRALGSTVGAGIVGAGAWVLAGSLAIAGIAALISFFIMLVAGTGGGIARRGGGGWIPTGGGGFGGGGFGGGGFSGGGGGFGGGGASGGWN
jgi:uncharacterized protein